jgi:mannose-1-phosphate guanylyltransferase
LARAREAGVTRVILGTAYRAEVFADAFGDGSGFGLQLDHSFEPEPLGTGGGIAQAGAMLRSGPDEPVLVFNGDVLTGVDIAHSLDVWRESGAEVGLYLVRVENPRAYGLVPTDAQGLVTAFLEKPETDEEVVTNQINAGMYIMKRRIIDRIPKGQVVSVEREVFPTLLAEGVKTLGIVDDRYWLDLGTPAALLKGSADLVRGYAPSPLLSTNSALRLDRSALIFDDSVIDSSAEITGGSVVMPGAQVGAGAKVQGSVVSRGVRVGPNAIVQGCYLAEGVEVENGARIHDQVVC